MEKATLKVTGMTCGGCVNSVTSVINSVEGVKNVKVDLETERATFEIENSRVDLKHIIAEIEDIGFGASIPSAQ